MDQKFSAGDVLTRTAAALARAAQTLEELCRMDEYCPYRHQPVPREWRLDECSKCSYSNIPRRGIGVQPDIVHHDNEFRAMCWVLYFLWEVEKRDEKQSSS